MKNNLIFKGQHIVPNENIKELLQCFLYNEVGIDYYTQFGNVHHFKTRSGENRRAPVVARFIYHSDLEFVLSVAKWLKDTFYGLWEQFLLEIEKRPRSLYPVMRTTRQEGWQASMVRDKLYTDNQQYIPKSIHDDQASAKVMDGAAFQDTSHQTHLNESHSGVKLPPKRQCQGSSPKGVTFTNNQSTPYRKRVSASGQPWGSVLNINKKGYWPMTLMKLYVIMIYVFF